MYWKKKVLFILIGFLIIGTQADGEFSVVYTCDAIAFKGHSRIHENALKELLSTVLGMTVKPMQWSGIDVYNPFDLPEAVLHLHVQGVRNLGSAEAWAKSYPLETDEFEPRTYETVKSRFEHRKMGPTDKFLNIQLSNYTMVLDSFPNLVIPRVHVESLTYLETNVREDIAFLQELANLNAIIDWINKGYMSRDNMRDFYYFRFITLTELCHYHGVTSFVVSEAKTLLRDAVLRLSEALVQAYDGSAIVTLACHRDDKPYIRPARHVVQKRSLTLKDFGALRRGGAATNGTDDNNISLHAAIEQMFLWLSIVTSLALVYAVHKLLSIDPGKDSINYRFTMTSTKKDN